jgi:hypothetical protein
MATMERQTKPRTPVLLIKVKASFLRKSKSHSPLWNGNNSAKESAIPNCRKGRSKAKPLAQTREEMIAKKMEQLRKSYKTPAVWASMFSRALDHLGLGDLPRTRS